MASASTAPTFPIVNLQDLNAFTEAAFTANYLHNLTTIFNFVPEDVPTVLTPRTFNTLKGLRKDLLTMVASTSLDLSTKTALTRRNKEDVINDILLLSEYLVKPEHSIDLSSIYTPSVSDVNIIDVVNKLLTQVNALKSENRALRDRVAALEANQSATPQDTPINAVSSDDDLVENDVNSKVSIIDEDDEDQKELDALDNYVPPPSWPHHAHRPVVTTPRPVVPAPCPVVAAPRPVVAAPRPVKTEKAFVWIGNVDTSCNRRSIMNHLASKKVSVTLNDIELRSELRSKRLFKVTVPFNKVQQALTNWPSGIETKRWPCLPSPSSNHSQKFRKGHTIYSGEYNHRNWSQWSKIRQSKFKNSRNWSQRQSSN